MLTSNKLEGMDMARKKARFESVGDMFGHSLNLLIKGRDHMVIGRSLESDPTLRFDKELSDGYLFRSPKADPDGLATIWATLSHFSGAHRIWVEYDEKDGAVELTAFARFSDKGEATMFAFSHSEFQKWSDDQEKAEAKQRRRKPTKVRVTKDGRLTARVTVETLKD